ncbi:MFS general substrate transporter [Clavulina sp. PMI_390]|nr:MFS general substrate transporter [Clavulina sp. PMI_390]
MVGSPCTFSTFGYANSWGIFQDYYQTNLLPNKSPSDIAWIGSVQYALVLLPGIISGRLMDLGYLHVPLGIASATQILAIFLAAECTQYWQFILCQGILLGLGAGFAFGPCLAITAHWFLKRRPVAYGVVATGSSIGGVVFPLAVKRLLEDVGFKWTMRITGFMLIFTFTLANLLVKKRLPPKNVKGGLFNFAIFLNPAFSLFATGCLLGFLGIYTALTYSDVAAIEAGLNPNLALSLVAIANGCSFFGRISSGLLAGRLGPFNILIPWTIVAGLMTWLWPYATTSGPGVVIVMVIYGCASGAFVGLIAIPLSHPAFGEQGDLGRRIGMIFTISALGALAGTPISGAIHTAVGGYKAVGWYAGSLGMLACVFLFLARRAAIGKWFARF